MSIGVTTHLLLIAISWVLVAASCSVQAAQPNNEPDVQGDIKIMWHKVAPGSIRHYCINSRATSCLMVRDHTCHIIASDTWNNLKRVGHEFVDCVYKKETTAHSVPPYKQNNNRQVHYWFTVSKLTIAEACGEDAVSCFKYVENDKVMIFIPIPKTPFDFTSIGHEVKHVVDGFWHDDKGVSLPGVFLHYKKKGKVK